MSVSESVSAASNGSLKSAHYALTAEQRERVARQCRRKYDALIEPLREVARRYGYALCVHGSLARDIDLVAVPWIANAQAPSELATALYTECCRVEPVLSHWSWAMGKDRWYTMAGCPGRKSHGRLGWTIVISGGTYIDLGVMPPITERET